MQKNITFWRDAAFSGIETCLVRKSHHRFPKHVHDTVYAVGLMENGASYSLGRGRDDGLVAAGQIALINPGQVHSGVPASISALTYRMLYFDTGLIRTAAGDLNAGHGILPEFTAVVINDPALRQKLRRLSICMASQAGHLEKNPFYLMPSPICWAAMPACQRRKILRATTHMPYGGPRSIWQPIWIKK